MKNRLGELSPVLVVRAERSWEVLERSLRPSGVEMGAPWRLPGVENGSEVVQKVIPRSRKSAIEAFEKKIGSGVVKFYVGRPDSSGNQEHFNGATHRQSSIVFWGRRQWPQAFAIYSGRGFK